MQMKAKGHGAEKGKKEEERGGGTDLRWLMWRFTVVLVGGGGSKRRCCRWRSTVSSPFVFPCFLFVFSFFSFSCSSFLSSSSGLIFFLSFGLFTLSSTLLCSPPSVFIGKTEGGGKTPYYPYPRGTWPGRPLYSRPEPPKGYVPFLLPPRGKQVGRLSRRLFEV